MSMSDPIADMLTRLRNAQMAHKEIVEIPHSGVKGEIAGVLRREGYVKDVAVEGGTIKTLRVFLKYTVDEEPVIRGLKRDSRPGRRTYVGADAIPRILGGLGIAILSTSAGVMTDREARRRHVGGELLCRVW